MSVFTRMIHIRSHDLGKDVTLLLTFDKSLPDMYHGVYPIAWRVKGFGATGNYSFQATYVSQLAFTKAQEPVGPTFPYVPINTGHQTTLRRIIKGPDLPIYEFSDPVPGVEAGKIRAHNKAEEIVKIGVGSWNESTSELPWTLLLFDNVHHDSSVTAEFTPRLSAYITSCYREGDVIHSEIPSPVIWEQNLIGLRETTYWELKRLPNGGYTLEVDTALG